MTDSTLPSLDLVRQVTDQHVLDQLLGADELTRAEIAARTGISKPTISESVRRLVAAGLLSESGRQVGKRGPAGTYFQLPTDLGVALAVAVGPAGVVVQTHDLRGRIIDHLERPVPAPIDAARLDPVITAAVSDAIGRRTRVRGCAVSVAGPVDQSTGRLVRLGYSPFLLDELDPRALLGELVGSAVEVDNDVNWAALAEHHEGSAQDVPDFFYCYLGSGLGSAVVINGGVVHGSGGLAGELAHVRTTGPGGRSLTLLECFAAADLLLAGSQAIDVDRLKSIVDGTTTTGRRQRSALADAVAGVIASVTALLNPYAVVVGGPWGTYGGFDQLVADRVDELAAIATDLRPAALGEAAPLAGARIQALRSAQASLAGDL